VTVQPSDGLAVGPVWLVRDRVDEDPLRWPAADAAPVGMRWTTIGSLGAPGRLDAPRAVVDPFGLVAPELGGWSLDWWIGAEDRWHLPSRETAVRQRLVDDAPVVETAMRIPGGDVIHRVYAVRTETGDDALVVEIENATPVPFAAALAIRPYGVDGPARIHELALEGTEVCVDGALALVLPRAPNRTATATRSEGDCATLVLTGAAGSDRAFSVRCDRAGAQAALLYPVPHTATLRALLPLASSSGSARSTRPEPGAQPAAAQVASGWATQCESGARFELPPGRLADAVSANHRFLLLAAGGSGSGHDAPLDRAAVVGALDRWGHGRDAGVVLAAQASLDDEALTPVDDRGDSVASALVALADHVRLTADDELLEVLADRVADGAARIRRAAAGPRLRRRGALGLLAPSTQPSWLAPGRYFRDDLWAIAGLLGAAELLGRAGEHRAARTARTDAASLWAALPDAFAPDASGAGPDLPGGSPDAEASDARVANLDACQPLGLVPPDHPLVVATVDALRAGRGDDDGVAPPSGPPGHSPELTMALAATELAGGDPIGLARLDRILGWLSPTFTWPDVVDPISGVGAGQVGHHLPTGAAFLRLVRDLCVRDERDGLALVGVVPPTWLGQSLEVRGAPTRFGTLSYAVRWHGDRPALLWELDPHPNVTSITLRARGLDRDWLGEGLRGEALLAAPVT
jgi:hypothetical protein